MQLEEYYGRLVVDNAQDQHPSQAQQFKAITENVCFRCGTKILDHWQTRQHERYCWACAKLGRLSEHHRLYTIAEPHMFSSAGKPVMRWTGKLSPVQAQISRELIKSYECGQSHLVYAVTGAGKTEMLYPLLEYVMQHKHRVAYVAPRIDVVIEISQRIRHDFMIDSVLLYGDSPEEYHYTQLTFATTHQLLNFYQAFDLIIVDEVDAFPYAGNILLKNAMAQARLPTGRIVYLSATPMQQMLRACRKGQLGLSMMPRRYHGHPLPELTLLIAENWRQRWPYRLKKLLQQYAVTKQRFLIFVPEIADIPYVLNWVVRYVAAEAVFAADEQRVAKVQAMREHQIQGLVTTTILERGVTFPNLDVVNLGADEAFYSEAALIQMAGRCGRSKDFPTGLVLCVVTEKTHKVHRAAKEIRRLNRMR